MKRFLFIIASIQFALLGNAQEDEYVILQNTDDSIKIISNYMVTSYGNKERFVLHPNDIIVLSNVFSYVTIGNARTREEYVITGDLLESVNYTYYDGRELFGEIPERFDSYIYGYECNIKDIIIYSQIKDRKPDSYDDRIIYVSDKLTFNGLKEGGCMLIFNPVYFPDLYDVRFDKGGNYSYSLAGFEYYKDSVLYYMSRPKIPQVVNLPHDRDGNSYVTRSMLDDDYDSEVTLINADGSIYGYSLRLMPLDDYYKPYYCDPFNDFLYGHRKSSRITPYLKKEHKGNAEMMYKVGQLYQEECDHKTAVKWYKKALEKGYIESKVALGDAYMFGRGVKEQDKTKAVELYSQAAREGSLKAKECLGYCYYWGEGVDRDLNTAVKWFTLSSDSSEESRHYLEAIFSTDFVVNEETYKFWKMIADSVGNEYAQYGCGYCLINGIGAEKDIEEAFKYFKLSLNHQVDKARLSYVAQPFNNYKAKNSEAYLWARQLRTKRHSGIYKKFGDAYYSGEYVTKDYESALYYYKKCLPDYPDIIQSIEMIEYKLENQQTANVKRCAILIGNSKYYNCLDLPSSHSDVILLKKSLTENGFRVYVIENAAPLELMERMRQIRDTLMKEQYTLSLVYYTGHGVECKGKSYVLSPYIYYVSPSKEYYDAKRHRVEFPEYMNFNCMLNILHPQGVVIGIFDACREVIQSADSLEWSPQVFLPKNTYIVYATSASENAYSDEYSDYALAFYNVLNEKEMTGIGSFLEKVNRYCREKNGQNPITIQTVIEPQYR